MPLRPSDLFFPSPERVQIELTDKERTDLHACALVMKAVWVAAFTALMQYGEYSVAQSDFEGMDSEIADRQAVQFIESYEDQYGVGAKFFNFGLYRACKDQLAAQRDSYESSSSEK